MREGDERGSWKILLDDDLFQLIAEQTNLCSCQLIGASINSTVDESFVGIKLIMGVVRVPFMDEYWAEGTPKISQKDFNSSQDSSTFEISIHQTQPRISSAKSQQC